jgi:hypothetical protein
MYTFTTHKLAGLKVSGTVAQYGTEHHKVYSESGVTPITQNTLNVYVSGTFQLSCGEWTQVVEAGQSSLDLTIGEYPKDEPVIEKVLSPWGTRFCISCDHPWIYEPGPLAAGESITVETESVLVVLEGEAVIGALGLKTGGYRLVRAGNTVRGKTDSRIVLCKVLDPMALTNGL